MDPEDYQHITRRSLVELRWQNPKVPWVRKRFRIYSRWTRVLPAKRLDESAWSLPFLSCCTPCCIRRCWKSFWACPQRNAHSYLCWVRFWDASAILAQEWSPRLLQSLLWQGPRHTQLNGVSGSLALHGHRVMFSSSREHSQWAVAAEGCSLQSLYIFRTKRQSRGVFLAWPYFCCCRHCTRGISKTIFLVFTYETGVSSLHQSTQIYFALSSLCPDFNIAVYLLDSRSLHFIIEW